MRESIASGAAAFMTGARCPGTRAAARRLVSLLGATLALVTLVLAPAGCSVSPAQSTLTANRSLWSRYRPASYRYAFNWSCFCPPELTATVDITVKDGTIVTVIETATGLPVAKPSDYRTIDGLFDFVQQAIDKRADEIDATYDTKWGYPSQVSIDYQKMAVDEEMAFSASGLTLVP